MPSATTKYATPSKFEAYVSEFIGTFFLVLTIGINVLQQTALAPVSIGSMLMVMIFATGKVSGGHFNPAVTLGVVLSGRRQIAPDTAAYYMIAQICGGLVASFTYCCILGATFTLAPGHGYYALDAIVAETLFTAALVFVVLSVATTSQDAGNQYFGLAIGFTVMAAAFAIGKISGCSLNPAVSFAVMISNRIHTGGGLEHFALYMLSPLLGSFLAAGLFRTVRAAEYKA